MDVDRLLNLERRTGVKDAEIDDFNRKVDDVQAAIKGLLDGTVDPSQVKIEGIESEEEKQQKEIERQARLKAQRQKEEELRQRRKKEERERWWAGAEMMRSKNSDATSENQNIEDLERAEDAKLRVMSRYTADYSKWDQWEPNDEATRAEEEQRVKEEDDKRNKEFEANNKEFCQQFIDDMQERKKVSEKKQGNADISRLKGNRYFKAKQFDRALELYMEAMKEMPFDVKTLTNIAQVQIKLKDYDEALEFIERTLFIDPFHVKALSRKAFVLGERGNTTEAVVAINLALKQDPTNTDLLAQQKELQIIEKEKEEERRLNEAIQGSDTASKEEQSESKHTDDEKMQSNEGVDDVQTVQLLQQKLQQHHGIENMIGSDESLYTLICELRKRMKQNTMLKAMIRTGGALIELTTFLKSILIAGNVERIIENNNSKELLAESFNLLGDAVEEQRASKMILIDEKILSAVKSVINEFSLKQLPLLRSLIRLLCICGGDDICVKMQLAVIGDKTLLGQIGEWMGNLSYNYQSSSSAAEIELVSSCLMDCAVLLKAATLTETNRSTFNNIDGAVGLAMVCGTAAAFYFDFGMKKASKDKEVVVMLENLAERLIEASLGLSQVEILRSHFVLEVPFGKLQRDDNQKQQSITLVMALLESVRQFPGLCTNAIASLMNACIDKSDGTNSSGESVRAAIAASGGAEMVLSDLHLTFAQRQKMVADFADENDTTGTGAGGSIFVRRAGLLARICTIPSVQKQLLQADNYRLLCRRISIENGSDAKGPQWMIDERSHYLRILASLSKPSVECMLAGLEENILQSLLAVLPTPRRECGDITARSVTLMPEDLAPAVQLGNAARCLIHYADHSKYAEMLYTTKEWLGVEKMICAMASCGDIRVRKNFAILLAKGCRVKGVREVITELRGMQMMIELQDKL